MSVDSSPDLDKILNWSKSDFRAILNQSHRCELSKGIFGERASVIGRQRYKKSASMWAA